jgi:allophanate hydrolase subunit 1
MSRTDAIKMDKNGEVYIEKNSDNTYSVYGSGSESGFCYIADVDKKEAEKVSKQLGHTPSYKKSQQ